MHFCPWASGMDGVEFSIKSAEESESETEAESDSASKFLLVLHKKIAGFHIGMMKFPLKMIRISKYHVCNDSLIRESKGLKKIIMLSHKWLSMSRHTMLFGIFEVHYLFFVAFMDLKKWVQNHIFRIANQLKV